MEGEVSFFTSDISFELPNEGGVSDWIRETAATHSYTVLAITYIFASDEYVLQLNREYLSHDYYTDILTFPMSEPGVKELQADIYISIDRVKDNADELGISFTDELHRVMIHGLLHLCGFDDHSDPDRAAMRRQEEMALSLRKF